jgi:hypothetical protein
MYLQLSQENKRHSGDGKTAGRARRFGGQIAAPSQVILVTCLANPTIPKAAGMSS